MKQEMKGLELSKNFYFEIIEPAIKSRYPNYLKRIAAGLFGHGSQCLGFDDEISWDHDWGPRVCILLNDADYKNFKSNLITLLKEVPSEYRGFKVSWKWSGKPRGGILNINEWFTMLLDGKEIPRNPTDWLKIREYELLFTTNGEIWHDGLGEVTQVRNMLKYYSEAVWKKRLARKCAEISQSKSNVIRSLKRKDNVAASLALHFFIKEAMQICFLLNHKYAPFYKWLYRAFASLPKLSMELKEEIGFLCMPHSVNDKLQTLDKVLDRIRNEINVQMPFTSNYDKFYIISDEINKNIDDSDVREIDIWDTAEY